MTSRRFAGETPTRIQKVAPSAEEHRATFGRAEAAIGASRASRSPGCGTLCRQSVLWTAHFCWDFKVRSGRARL